MLLHLGQESLDPKSPVEDDKEESQLHISRWERKGEKVPIYKFLFFLSFPHWLSFRNIEHGRATPFYPVISHLCPIL